MTPSSQFTQTIRHFMDIVMHHSMRERTLFAKRLGLSMPQLGILMQLHHRGNCGVSDIGDRFDITNAAASQLVDKLVQSGLIRREEDPHDRRAKLLNLTDKARALIQEGIEERYRWVDQLVGKLNAEERAQVIEAVDIMIRAGKELELDPASQSA